MRHGHRLGPVHARAGWLAVAATLLQCTRLMSRQLWVLLAPSCEAAGGLCTTSPELLLQQRDETLRRWTSTVDGSRPITSDKKRSGAQAKLDHEQREIATGWVLSANKKIAGATRSFVLDSFDVNPSTVARYLAEFDLSRQMLGSRPRPENVSFEQWKATTTSWASTTTGSSSTTPISSGQSISPARPSSSSEIGEFNISVRSSTAACTS